MILSSSMQKSFLLILSFGTLVLGACSASTQIPYPNEEKPAHISVTMQDQENGFIRITESPFECFSLWVEDNPTEESFTFFEEQPFDLPPGVVPSSIPPFIMQGPSGQEDISLAVHEDCITPSTLAYASDGEIYPSQYYVDKWVFFLPYNKVYRFGDPGIYGKINNLVAYSGEMFITHVEFKSPSIEPITVTIDSAPPGMTYGEAGGSRFFRWDVPLDATSGDYVIEATASQNGNFFPLRFEFEVLNLEE